MVNPESTPYSDVRLGTRPSIKYNVRSAPTEDQVRQITALIEKFGEIETPDLGLCATTSGCAFSPIDGHAKLGALLLTEHRLQTSAAMHDVVTLGPKCLPFLLSRLNDQTQTKLRFTRCAGIGTISLCNDIRDSLVDLTTTLTNQREQFVRRQQAVLNGPRFDGHALPSYTVTIGDVCFVAIGQIVGRRYQAVRYRPTACVAVNSPAHDPDLCNQVRTIWSSDDPSRAVFESLCLDYATEGRSEWGQFYANLVQVEAAMRLLFYFPAESRELIAKRLGALDVRSRPSRAERRNRDLTNNVCAEDFIAAVMWSGDPLIAKALADIRNRTDDERILEVFRQRLNGVLVQVP